MVLTREEVVWGYRIILGREPESDDVINGHLYHKDLASLRDSFIKSPEFQRSKYEKPESSRFLSAASHDIDITSTSAQLQKMFDRIGAEWKKFGREEPHWSVLTNEFFKAERIDKFKEEFYGSGAVDLRDILAPISRAGLQADRFDKVMDFGCGVGRLTLAVAPLAETVIGVDISPPHLELARERRNEVGIENVVFEDIANMDDLDRYHGFDLIFSIIVIQHNPPPIMAAILSKLLKALKINGIAVLQFPTYIHGQSFNAADYLASTQPAMEMNALPQRIAFEIVRRAGCMVVDIREDDRLGTIPGVSNIMTIRKMQMSVDDYFVV